ncbi:MAG TPA: ferric reductase-like transmembrane domain-containing protein [Pseudomonas sp.]|nr:ferric reductase-like transmembrane domain-containing protein [Pseudomonas sp.]
MKAIKRTYWVLFAVITLLWWLADDILAARGFFPLRSSLVNLSGLLAMGAMSLAVLLAVRPALLERRLGGLDKVYRLHKWLGISALVLSVIHWGWAQIPKWLVGWGLLEKPARKGLGAPQDGILGWFHSQRGFAEDIGEWAFYVALVLIVLALVKRFPYRYFFKTHRLLALAYLVLAFHGLVLMKPEYWSTPLAPLFALFMLLGSIAGLVSLTRRIGHRRRVLGEVAELERHPDNRVLRVTVQLQDRWPGHEAGQFAFVTFDPQEGPHPFTISSAWHEDGRLTFLIKAIGDYTAALPQRLKIGESAVVEGPYGRFDFQGRKAAQIWVGGGIGITPFIARLQWLAKQRREQAVDLFYCTSEPDEAFIARLRLLACNAGVRLHLLVSQRDGRLTPERLYEEVPGWRDADVWFCGPLAFGQNLRQGLAERGMAIEDFHHELFDMR